MSRQIGIEIYQPNLTDEQIENYPAIVDDYDADNGVLLLLVAADDVDADYRVESFTSKTEAWGVVAHRTETDMVIEACSWNGYGVLNYEEVCWQIEEMNRD